MVALRMPVNILIYIYNCGRNASNHEAFEPNNNSSSSMAIAVGESSRQERVPRFALHTPAWMRVLLRGGPRGGGGRQSLPRVQRDRRELLVAAALGLRAAH